jgi:hypothetical protein
LSFIKPLKLDFYGNSSHVTVKRDPTTIINRRKSQIKEENHAFILNNSSNLIEWFGTLKERRELEGKKKTFY